MAGNASVPCNAVVTGYLQLYFNKTEGLQTGSHQIWKQLDVQEHLRIIPNVRSDLAGFVYSGADDGMWTVSDGSWKIICDFGG